MIVFRRASRAPAPQRIKPKTQNPETYFEKTYCPKNLTLFVFYLILWGAGARGRRNEATSMRVSQKPYFGMILRGRGGSGAREPATRRPGGSQKAVWTAPRRLSRNLPDSYLDSSRTVIRTVPRQLSGQLPDSYLDSSQTAIWTAPRQLSGQLPDGYPDSSQTAI